MGFGQGLACDLTLNSTLPAELRSIYQDQLVIRRILTEARTIAIVGLSPRRERAANFVATYLEAAGYEIIPVNPRYDAVLGKRCYASLSDVPVSIDLVDVFRPASACMDVAREAEDVGARALWLQLRIVSVEAAELALEAGLDVVMDRCIKMEHGRYDGSMHYVGMNTGIISARRARHASVFRDAD